MTDYQKLRRLAEQATPGPWGVTHFSGGVSFAGPPTVYAGTDPEFGEPRKVGETEADAAYIAAANPATILALLDRVAALEELGRAVVESCNDPKVIAVAHRILQASAQDASERSGTGG